ncbi:ABC transporter permease [Rapidithrix thailandica]|uniref:Transport permease protein n=1 Tax=Rapidithrix thailandica TaxID=413964 RepID=A0AAW9S7C8_9BACT
MSKSKAEEFNLVIKPGSIEKNYWLDLWRFRELFYILSWRDIKVRYKQTVIGIAWAVIRPLLTMLVLTFVFSNLANMSSEGNAPYQVMVFAGMLPWQFFSNALSTSSNSLITNTNLISKVYFPRMIVPASSIITSFVDFLISFCIMAVIMAYYQYVPPVTIFFLPIFILIAFTLSFGIGLFLTTLNVKFRDFKYIVPFIIQFGLYISPVGYSSSEVDAKWQFWYSLNPMVGVIDGFRWAILGTGENIFYSESFYISVGVSVLVLIISIRFFRKLERSFADII